jgi:hypothetical protein
MISHQNAPASRHGSDSKAVFIGMDSGDHLRITLLEVASDDFVSAGDLRVRVEVSSDGFVGSCYGVWLPSAEFEDFLEDLTNLEATRSGEVSLRSTNDPCRVELRIYSFDSSGHLAARGFLLRAGYGPRRRKTQMITFDIEFDGGCFQQLLRDFHRFKGRL